MLCSEENFRLGVPREIGRHGRAPRTDAVRTSGQEWGRLFAAGIPGGLRHGRVPGQVEKEL